MKTAQQFFNHVKIYKLKSLIKTDLNNDKILKHFKFSTEANYICILAL